MNPELRKTVDTINEQIEQFLSVVGYEGIYEVSSFGRVRVLPRTWKSGINTTQSRPGKILSQSSNTDGYKCVTLIKNGKTKGFKVHRLVAIAFITCKDSTLEVNHIDGDKAYNSLENLEWCSHTENMLHARKEGLWKLPKRGNESKLSRKVVNTVSGEVYGCVADAGKAIGVKRSTLTNWLNGRMPNKSKLIYL